MHGLFNYYLNTDVKALARIQKIMDRLSRSMCIGKSGDPFYKTGCAGWVGPRNAENEEGVPPTFLVN